MFLLLPKFITVVHNKYKIIFSSRSDDDSIWEKTSSSYHYFVVIMTGFVFVWKVLLYHGELHRTDFSPRNHTSTRPSTVHAHIMMIFVFFCIFIPITFSTRPDTVLADFMMISFSFFLFFLFFSTRPGTDHAQFIMMVFLKLWRSTSLVTCSCQKGFVATGQLPLPNNLDEFFVRLEDISKKS